ncbi:MAG: Gfo/Idh/MocA family oxidoreductase [Methylacidiphilales bacterium]|nr:Gfo/Idh/MocA family oxidoreductase [Candidatus Methylacidiphilales bacterium]
MHQYRTAIIGVGRGGEGKAGSHSIGYAHANAYLVHPRTTLVAACDLSVGNLKIFSESYKGSAIDTDAKKLLAETGPDIVSICTYAGSHRELFELCLEAGVKGIWCEKPLALMMDDVHFMVKAAEKAGVKVVTNHYRRYGTTFRQAKQMIKEGALGELSMIFSSIQDWDLMEWGTHWLDMSRFFVDDAPVRWVMGQARCNGEKKGYGHIMEQHALAYYAFENGVRGLLDGGVGIPGLPSYAMKVVGTDGQLEIGEGKLVLLNRQGFREVPVKNPTDPAQDSWQLLLNDFIAWLEGGKESQLSLRNAALSTELYLAAYESAKTGDRIDLPLASQREFPLDEIARRQTVT